MFYYIYIENQPRQFKKVPYNVISIYLLSSSSRLSGVTQHENSQLPPHPRTLVPPCSQQVRDRVQGRTSVPRLQVDGYPSREASIRLVRAGIVKNFGLDRSWNSNFYSKISRTKSQMFTASVV